MAIPEPSTPRCIFGDVQNFLNKRIKRTVIERMSSFAYADMHRIVMQPGALAAEGWCERHHQVCRLATAFLHVAGPPCVDFSSQGKQLGVDGSACLAMLIWLAMRVKLEEDVIIFENVTRFHRHLLEQAFGHK